jgi:hypothetical protein
MANIFLEDGHDDIETAIMLERATQCDLALLSPSYKNAVAFTDGKKVFINSDDNLARILPDYNKGMLKWLLWHERYHMELKHHKRYFDFLDDIRKAKDTFGLSQSEVNIIMDILVHDSLAKMFPELIDTAVNNLAQMRNRNSLSYTFTTFTLEEMLQEFADSKKPPEDADKSPGEGEGEETESEPTTEGSTSSSSKKKSHSEATPGSPTSGKSEHKDEEPEEEPEETSTPSTPEPEHDKTDWSKLKEIDDKEFITKDETGYLEDKINRLKRKKFKLAKLTQTLNGMVTTTKMRTYRTPSRIQLQPGVIMKGKLPGRTSIYLIFDASGSMGSELAVFKKIVKEAIPQAMDVPTEWFSGWTSDDSDERTKYDKHYEGRTCRDYHKGKFKDIMEVHACSGYNDDGDRVIELCVLAEEKGFSPIGVTDGGGGIYNPAMLKKLKRTILVGQNGHWLAKAKSINPNIQTLEIELD